MDFYEYISPSRSGSKALQLAWDMFSKILHSQKGSLALALKRRAA
jgi:hypothetical protein